jgi:membrane protease YdiL (CAAX protease family)
LLARFLFRVFGMEDWIAQQEGLGDLFQSYHWSVAVLAIGIGPGIVEELWCRGLLGRGLVGRYGWGAGVALTSLFFGCLHLFPPPYVLTTAVMGAGLHFTYAVSRSLWVPIILHTLNNSIAALQAVGTVPSGGMEAALSEQPLAAGALALGLLLAAGTAMWGARVRSDSPAILPGLMVPPEGTGVTLVTPHARPTVVAATAVAVGLSGWLMLLLAG